MLTGRKETMTSLEIAELTGKQHQHVMRDVRALLDQGVDASNFGLTSYTDKYKYLKGTTTIRFDEEDN